MIGTRAFQEFLDDMFETMNENDGIGLAASQVSRSAQFLVMGCEGDEGFPQTVLINPKIVFYGPQQVEICEGCLSLDGLRGKVTRPSTIRVQALDRQGKLLDFQGECFLPHFQHTFNELKSILDIPA